jgi:hypothetical protein
MTISNLDRIVEEVRALTTDEQRTLRGMLDQLIATDAPRMTEEEFEQRLLAKGIISRIPPRIRDAESFANRRLIEVEGKPLSEIIIEERR